MPTSCSTRFTTILLMLRNVIEIIFHSLHYSFSSSLRVGQFFLMQIGFVILLITVSKIEYCFFLRETLICWQSKKQSIAFPLSSKSEYRVLTDTAAEFL